VSWLAATLLDRAAPRAEWSHGPPNGWRVSGEPGRAQRATRVRCTRGLGGRTSPGPNRDVGPEAARPNRPPRRRQ
jgi:hypothetical protein